MSLFLNNGVAQVVRIIAHERLGHFFVITCAATDGLVTQGAMVSDNSHGIDLFHPE